MISDLIYLSTSDYHKCYYFTESILGITKTKYRFVEIITLKWFIQFKIKFFYIDTQGREIRVFRIIDTNLNIQEEVFNLNNTSI